jgi:hypothetical protein
MSKRTDPDMSCIKACCRALNRSTSRRMLRANLDFLVDRYLTNPPHTLPKRLLKSRVTLY